MKRFILPLLALSFGVNALALTKDEISQPSADRALVIVFGDDGYESNQITIRTVKPTTNEPTAIIIPDCYNKENVVSVSPYTGLTDDIKVTVISVEGDNALTQTSSMESIETISIGKYVRQIEGKAFSKIFKNGKNYTFKSLKSITINATTPPDVTGCSFDGFDKANVVLFVPEESVAAYKASDLAQHFSKVVAIGQNPDDAPGTGTAVDNNEVEESFTVVGRQIRLNGVQRVQVYNLTGSLVLDEVTDEATIEGNGVFIVRTATQTEKVSCR